mmetsp:Transcript_6581/g.19397  ORF Transcript_6581/g.19397 Transcript_6581/m.19397 type:complete len:311 (-) Transcript_6581:1850-2782(-)
MAEPHERSRPDGGGINGGSCPAPSRGCALTGGVLHRPQERGEEEEGLPHRPVGRVHVEYDRAALPVEEDGGDDGTQVAVPSGAECCQCGSVGVVALPAFAPIDGAVLAAQECLGDGPDVAGGRVRRAEALEEQSRHERRRARVAEVRVQNGRRLVVSLPGVGEVAQVHEVGRVAEGVGGRGVALVPIAPSSDAHRVTDVPEEARSFVLVSHSDDAPAVQDIIVAAVLAAGGRSPPGVRRNPRDAHCHFDVTTGAIRLLRGGAPDTEGPPHTLPRPEAGDRSGVSEDGCAADVHVAEARLRPAAVGRFTRR